MATSAARALKGLAVIEPLCEALLRKPRRLQTPGEQAGSRHVLFCYSHVRALPWAGVGIVDALVRACGARSPAELREQAGLP